MGDGDGDEAGEEVGLVLFEVSDELGEVGEEVWLVEGGEEVAEEGGAIDADVVLIASEDVGGGDEDGLLVEGVY